MKPEPSELERQAIVLALREDADVGRATAKPWRGAAADDAEEVLRDRATAEDARGNARVIEARYQGQDERHQQRPPGDVVAP